MILSHKTKFIHHILNGSCLLKQCLCLLVVSSLLPGKTGCYLAHEGYREHLLKLHDLPSSVGVFFLEFVSCFVVPLNVGEAVMLLPFQTAPGCCNATSPAVAAAQRFSRPMYLRISTLLLPCGHRLGTILLLHGAQRFYERRRKSFFLRCKVG